MVPKIIRLENPGVVRVERGQRDSVSASFGKARTLGLGLAMLVGLWSSSMVWSQSQPEPKPQRSADARAVQEIDKRNSQVVALGRRGLYAEALVLAQQTFELAERRLGPAHRDTGTSANNLAYLYQTMGQYGEALRFYERALAIREKALGSAHPLTAQSVNNLGYLYQAIGQYGKALPLFERALTIYEEAREDSGIALSVNNLGYVYRMMGMYGKAQPWYERALAINERALGPEHPTTAGSLNNLGYVHQAIGQYAKALPLHKRALAIYEKTLGPSHPDTARSVNSLGSLYQAMGQYDQALPLYRRALAINEKALGPEHPATATSLNNLGFLYHAMGQYDRALRFHERAFAIILLFPTPAQRSVYSANLCALHRNRKQPTLAIFYCKLAVNQYQQLRQGARELDVTLQRSLTAQGEPTYRELAKLLIQQGRIAEAEQVLGMLKEYEYFEFVRRDAQSDPRATRASYTPAEQALVDRLERNAQALSALYAQLDALQRINQRTAAQEAERAKLDEARSLLSEQLAALMKEIQRQLTERASVTGSELAHLDELKGSMRDTLAELHDKTGVRAAVLYLLPGEKNTTYLVITKDGPFSVQAGESEERLKTLIAQLRREIRARDPSYRTTADTLYRALIQPVRAHLLTAGVDSLMLYLTEYLRYLPFAALYDQTTRQHLIEQYALSVYTHVARETLRDDPVRKWSAVALGLSEARPNFRPLPAVEQELRQVVRDPRDQQPAGVFAGRRYLNAEFTRQQLKSLVDGEKRYSVMHVATHFNLAPGNEERSFLLTGDGDQVTLKQIRTDAGMKFRSFDLVTLSACETFITTGELSGSEIEGLGTLLQKQGAKAVLATLWRVEDAGTARLMEEFYRARGEERLTTKAEALRRAQRALLTGKATAPGVNLTHPYFWAPFVLMGNWL